MTDLAAEGDRLHAAIELGPWPFLWDRGAEKFAQWADDNWPAIAAALRRLEELESRESEH